MPLFGNAPSGNQDRAEGEITPSHAPLFNANASANHKGQTPATVIAKGVKLEGEFKSQGDVLIDGEVEGNIQTDGLLNVGPEAFLKAGVIAADATIAGRVEGNITVRRRLEIKATARTKGDIVCQTAVVEAGAVLQGNIRCGEEGNKVVETKPQAETKPSAPPASTDGPAAKPAPAK